ncbi:TonB-dependent receptor [Maribacter sp. MJ134]|uniref:TonB-dependent receptor domain-containing protein n=1 Tax=Maribacter sp. MJ134 TaxID=2496865 RepID=UPI000F8231CB|nr:TonB-dependent receptor [Maribacter sp. MJ134]AZQ58422.1 TonB-dependent receptor [Maribacter sp. MJ134]
MKNIFLLLLLLCITSINGQRQGGNKGQRPSPITITGKVIDQETSQPLEYATFVLQSIRNPDKITGGITDIDGIFNVETPPGKYNLSIEYIGYKTYKSANQEITKNTDIGTVKLQVSAAQLEGVEIVAEKTTVEVRLDKKVYNVGKDLTNSGATISDALDNIPSVTVDVDGAVALRGNGNVRILINGRPSALAGFGSTDALRQLPADAIEKVEVITSPSARYDAEGTAGILNIVLKKEKTRGVNGTINTTVGFPAAASLTANLNLRKEKYNLFTTLGYSYREPPGNGFADNTYFSDASEFDRIIEERDINRINSGFNLNLGVEYFLTETSSITASAFARTNDGEDITENIATGFVAAEINRIALRVEDEQEEEKSAQFSLNYNNDFNTEGHKLTVDLQLSYDEEFKPTPITENQIFPSTAPIANLNIEELELQNEYLAQVDYVLPMGDAQFEAGYRGNWEQSDTDFYLEEELDLGSGVFIPNAGLVNRFVFNQNVNSFYTQYGDKLGAFSYLAGLRLENTRLQGEIVGADVESLQEIVGEGIDINFDKNYLGLFPTLNLIYELAENENLTLGYNRRINRPRGRFINPFPSQSSRTNIFQGNPDLDPAFANAFDLGYLKRWEKLTLTSSIYYQKETNSFERVQEETGQVTSDGIVVIRSIPINLATNERVGAELGLLYNPAKWLRLNGSFNFFQFNSEGEFNGVDFGATNTSWFSRFSSKATLPGKIDWQTNAFYRGPTNNAQTENEGIFTLNLAFSKDILKDKGTLALNVSDLLNSRKRISSTVTPFFTSESEFQWRERQITLSFVYRINQNKKPERGGNRGNDDDDFEE